MDSNKNKIFAVIAIGVLILLLIGSTFAYFAAQGGDASQTDVNVLTHTVDSLVFETGDALSITADQTSFAQGKGNQTDSTFARATLKANSSTNTATDHYYVYLSIDENTFEYTTESKTAELILTVNKVDGETKTPLTSIDGLNYVTVGSVSGFDITEVNDLITIASNYEITSTGTKIDEWEVTLTLVNLDSNQNANTGKIFNAQLLIQKEQLLAQYIKNLFTIQGENNLYHHNGTITDNAGNIIDAEDGSYRYAGAFNDVNNYVCFGSDAEECEYDNLYRIIGVFGNNVKLIKAGFASNEVLGENGAFSFNIPMTSELLYLINYAGTKNDYKIGDSFSTYHWSSTNNNWKESELNNINLNTNYLTNIGLKWSEIIETYNWPLNGILEDKLTKVDAKETYDEEFEIKDTTIIDTKKIGMIYLSELFYGATPDNWIIGEGINSSNNIQYLLNNCIAILGEYSVSSIKTSTTDIVAVGDMNLSKIAVPYSLSALNGNYVIRPTFYLKSTIKLKGGVGTYENPYRIA